MASLTAAGVEACQVGDCLAASGIGDAVTEGHTAGRSL